MRSVRSWRARDSLAVMAPPAKHRAIKSAERTLALLELFSKTQGPLTVGQVSRELGIPQPSTSMLMHNLTRLGYLEHDRVHRTFAPSIRVALLGSWIGRRFDETHSLASRLDVLQRKVGETAYIAIQNGVLGQYVMAQSSDNPDTLDIASGQFRSLTCTAFGRALLAIKPDVEIASWVKRCNAEATDERLKVKLPQFMKLITQVRANGYGETAGDQTPGLGAFAMVFPSPLGHMPLAVGAGGPLQRVQKKKRLILAALRDFVVAFQPPA